MLNSRLSYRQHRYKKEINRYCELLNFLSGDSQLGSLPTYRINPKFNRKIRSNYLVRPFYQTSLFKSIGSCFFIQYFNKRRIRRAYRIRRRIFGYIKLQRTVRNLFISLHTKKGLLLYSSSICALGSKDKRERFGFQSLQRAGEKLAARLHAFGLHRISVHMRCFLSKGFRNLIWTLINNKVRIYKIFNFVKIPHGFMTLPARRRMKRRKSR
jgi:ribosomal protein S11